MNERMKIHSLGPYGYAHALHHPTPPFEIFPFSCRPHSPQNLNWMIAMVWEDLTIIRYCIRQRLETSQARFVVAALI